MTFHVGQMVVCVDDSFRGIIWRGEILPVKGQVYTIRSMYADGDAVGLRLEEIVNEQKVYSDGVNECAFNARYFRPVKQTSIDCFTAILTKTPETV